MRPRRNEGKGFAILSALQSIDVAAVPDRYQNVLPTLALGRLFPWCREAEVSADRAGLLCCGSPGVAYQAIMRLQHGLRADSPWIDPAKPEFDAQAVLKTFREWQYQPFLGFLLDLRRQAPDQPYYQERLAALKAWAEGGDYRRILGRRAAPRPGRLIEVVRIRAYELAPEGEGVDPYLIVHDGDRQVLRTAYAAGVREAEWGDFQSTDTGVEQPRAFESQPLFFEIWDSDYGDDAFIGGFAIHPRDGDGRDDGAGGRVVSYSAKILWDWKDATAVSRPGHAEVQVRFTWRRGAGGEGAAGPGEER